MDRQFWRIWFGRIKRIVFRIGFVIWFLLPFPYLYEFLKAWLPLVHSLMVMGWQEISFPASEQELFNEVRTIMLVIAAWYGVPFLIWRTRIADKQTQINQESHYTELFTKSVEQLGAVRQGQDEKPEPALETRIGAIYSLERLAKDSERDYSLIIEILAAYILEHCRDPKSFDDKNLSGKKLRQARQKWIDSLSKNPPAGRSDVVAALTVLSRREENRNWTSKSDDETQPDFTKANFQGANLRGADISEANLSEADLSGAYLWDADLSEADLSDADLSGADLWDADLSGAYLWKADLSGADLSEADLSGADLSEADLEDAYIRGTVLMGADLMGADLTGADLAGALLTGAQLKNSKGLTEEMIQKAFGDGATSLPNELLRPAHWGSGEEALEKWQAFCEEEWRKTLQPEDISDE